VPINIPQFRGSQAQHDATGVQAIQAGFGMGQAMRERGEKDEYQKRLQEIQERQEALKLYGTLADIMDRPKAQRGPLMKLGGQVFGAKFGVDFDAISQYAAQADDDTAKSLAESLRLLGVKVGQGEEDPRALLQFMKPESALPFLIRAAKEGEASRAEAERGKLLSDPGPKRATAVPEGSPISVADLDTQKQHLVSLMERAAGQGGLSEAQARAFKIRLDAIDEARARLEPKREKLHFATTGEGTVGLDPYSGARVGPAQPAAPAPDRYANEAERISGEMFDKPFAQLTQPERGQVNRRVQQERIDLAKAQAIAVAQGRDTVPERPSAGERKELAEFDAGVASIKTLLASKADPEIKKVLGMSPAAIGTRWAAGYIEGTPTDKQSIFLAELADAAGQIRRVLVGQAQTVPEMRSLLPLLPRESDPPDRVFTKLQAILQGMESKRGALEGALRGSNVRVPERAPGTRPSGPSGVDAARKRLGLD